MTTVEQTHYDRQVAYWLLLCAAVTFGMILLGAVTRLTHSGLSIVEWKPLLGAIPPLTEQDWHATFEQYKQFPEYQKVNRSRSMSSATRPAVISFVKMSPGAMSCRTMWWSCATCAL